jgi:hypothetical protein
MKVLAASLLSLVSFTISPTRSASQATALPAVHETSAGAATSPLIHAIDPAKEADIRRLLEVVHAGTVGVAAMNAMEPNVRKMMTSSLPPGDYRERLINLFLEKFHAKLSPKQLEDLAVPVYDKYYSDEDLRGLIQFYQTPLGQKMMTSMPKVITEASEAGQKWGQELGRQTMMEVLAEHPEIRQQLEASSKPTQPPQQPR